MTKYEMLRIVKKQLATDLNCEPGDFDKEGVVFREARENPGRRPFPRGERHIEMYTMGSAVIVSATPDILSYLRAQLEGKSREEAFDAPFVYGLGICHLPGAEKLAPIPTPDGIEIVTVAQPDIPKLYVYKGFPYAIWYGAHIRPETLVTVAYTENGAVAGMAGASDDCEMMWQIGINVLPEYRNRGIAAALTNRLAIEIMEREKIPYYGAAASNIASLLVARCAGFSPAWACIYRGRFDGVLTEPTS